MDGNEPSTLLSKYYRTTCLISIAGYCSLLLVFSYFHDEKCSRKFCNSEPFPEWMNIFHAVSFGATGGTCVLHGTRTLFGNVKGPNIKSAFVTMFIISLISASSQALQFSRFFTNTCEDVFGVRSPLVQWAEWQVSVPMMFFLNVSLDTTKSSLSYWDFIVIFTSYTGIGFTFIINLGFDFHTSVMFLCAAVLSMFVSLSLNVYLALVDLRKISSSSATSVSYDIISKEALAARKFSCSVYLAVIFPIFPAVYFAGLANVITKDMSTLITLILNFFAKILFSTFVMDSHLEVIDPNMYRLVAEKRSNEARRAFLRYVFHEVRVPLNSISMGLYILADRCDIFIFFYLSLYLFVTCSL